MKKRQFINLVFVLFTTCIVLSSCNKKDTTSPNDEYKDYKFEEPEVTGSVFYVDPENGSINGDGSSQNPWRTLQEVIEEGLIEHYRHSENYNPDSDLVLVNEGAPVKGGDKLILRNGYHGYITLSTFIFNDWLTIEAEEGHNPVLSRFYIAGAFRNFYLKNLTIKKDSYQGAGNYWDADVVNRNSSSCIYLGSSSFWGKGGSVKLQGLTIKSTDDISAWSADDWVQRAAGGIGLRSVENIEIYDCDIENVSMGITIEYMSDYSKVVGNSIKNYCLDGVRLISNHVLLAYNTIAGCYKVNDNHDDAIQSYSRGEDNSPGTGVLYNNIVRGNLIIGILDHNHPLAGTPQGIGCFDGFFDGWIVENNIVITNHYHGISFYGMRNSKIANNTVLDQIEGDDLNPWLMINNHKNGSESENCLVANNIVFRAISIEGAGVVERNNYILGRDNYDLLQQLFVNPEGFDFNLLNNELTNEHIIDKGEIIEGLVSSEIDKEQNARTLPPDLGALELR